jgi:GAF domain-containing protein
MPLVIDELGRPDRNTSIYNSGIPLPALETAVKRCCELTGASGAAVAISDGQRIVCRARAGSTAPDVGVEVPQEGVTALSIRSRRLWRCDDAEDEPSINQSACRALGIRSIVIAPICIPKQVLGVLEVSSPSPFAFDNYHSAAVQLIASALAVPIVKGFSHNRTFLPPDDTY